MASGDTSKSAVTGSLETLTPSHETGTLGVGPSPDIQGDVEGWLPLWTINSEASSSGPLTSVSSPSTMSGSPTASSMPGSSSSMVSGSSPPFFGGQMALSRLLSRGQEEEVQSPTSPFVYSPPTLLPPLHQGRTSKTYFMHHMN